MKNSKIIMAVAYVLLPFISFAQLKVYSDGKTYMGGLSTTPLSTLSVGGACNPLFTIYGYNPATTTAHVNAIRGENAAPTSNISSPAVCGIITPGTAGTCIGVVGAAYRTSAASGARAFGVYGYAGNSDGGYNYGVYGLLLGSNNGAGIYASLTGSTSLPGKYAAYFDGQIRTSNDSPIKPNAGSWSGASDERLKTDITSFTDGMNVISQINPIKYKFNGIGNMPTENYYYGVKAQQMLEIAPYTVGTIKLAVNEAETGTFNVIDHITADTTGVEKAIIEAYSFNYDALIYVMINALKEQDVKIEDMKNRLQQCCAASTPKSLNTIEENGIQQQQNLRNENSGANNATQVIDLSYSDNAILYQNIPNPFGDETTINYYLPQTINSAKIVFYNDMGQKIKEVILEHNSNASLNVRTSELSQGIYSYSLEVDGKITDTKRMIINK